MRFLSYSYSDHTCNYTPIKLKNTNLFVGATGSGKTRLFNTIWNLSLSIIHNGTPAPGRWELSFEAEGKIYEYIYSPAPTADGKILISEEKLDIVNPDGTRIHLIDRDHLNVFYKGNKLPKLQGDRAAISMLREEDSIQPVVRGFGSLVRRNFYGDELVRAAQLGGVTPETAAAIDRSKKLDQAFFALPLSGTLSILARSFKKKFEQIQSTYKGLFPFVRELDVRPLKDFPHLQNSGLPPFATVVAIKEAGFNEWLPISEISSGMLKVLLILTDLAILPEHSVYMIDEYENSLGVNAIDFLPSSLLEHDNIQFFLISHHPYLINNIPVKDWFVFGRQGKNIRIKFGDEVKERYGVSKQQSFMQLINDPFFVEGRA